VSDKRYQSVKLRGGYSVNTDYVKVPIFPDFAENFPDFSPDFMHIRQFDVVKSQLSHGLYLPQYVWIIPLNFK